MFGDKGHEGLEERLRTALISLERSAPDAAAALRAARAGGSRRRHSAWTLRMSRPWRSPQLIIGATALAAAIAVAAVVLPGVSAARRATSGPGRLPSAARIGRAMLTAFSSSSDDILYSVQVTTQKGYLNIDREWTWPAQPVTGQREIYREFYVGRSTRAEPIVPSEDDGMVFRSHPASRVNVDGRLTVVCYAGAGQKGGCGYGNTNTPAGAWSSHHGDFLNPNLDVYDGISKSMLAQSIAKGQWRVVRRTEVRGQKVIELAGTRTCPFRPLPVMLWVNARTYLPVRIVQGTAAAGAVTINWHYLPPTAANLGQLRVPIPAGYRHRG